jgi:hypothetical protein
VRLLLLLMVVVVCFAWKGRGKRCVCPPAWVSATPFRYNNHERSKQPPRSIDRLMHPVFMSIHPLNTPFPPTSLACRHVFHYLVEGGLIYLCMAEEGDKVNE